jgi:hypothetical protein
MLFQRIGLMRRNVLRRNGRMPFVGAVHLRALCDGGMMLRTGLRIGAVGFTLLGPR